MGIDPIMIIFCSDHGRTYKIGRELTDRKLYVKSVEEKQHQKENGRNKSKVIKNVLSSWHEHGSPIVCAVANVRQRNSEPRIESMIERVVILVVIVVEIHSLDYLRIILEELKIVLEEFF